MTTRRSLRARPGGVIRLTIHSRAVLAACWMPAVRGGGLFVPTDEDHALADRVCLVVSLMGAPPVPVMGEVVWVTPPGAVGHRVQGVGVRFEDDDNARRLRDAIGAQLPEAGGAQRYTF